MTDRNYTHLTLVVDRSGSMSSTREDAQGGINELLTTQFLEDGKLTVTLTEFDDHINTVARMATESFDYYLSPRGSTALWDAVGREINNTGADLRKLKEKDRPSKVIFVIVTDGGENASREYRVSQIKKLIDRQKDEYNWEFQFIGAGEYALQGADIGVHTTQYNAANTQGMWNATNVALASYRGGVGASFASVQPTSVN